MVTMKDVALLAGVSTATVSRALITPDRVAVLTKKRIEEAVLETGYSPSHSFKSMRQKDSKSIVVIVPDICEPYFADIIRGIEEVAMELGCLVLLGGKGYYKAKQASFSNSMLMKQVDGVILLGTDLPFNISKSEQKNLPPLVMVCEYIPELELPTIHIDNLTSAFKAVNYLTKMGHKKIAEIAGPKEAVLCKFRHQGYLQALYRANIASNPAYCIYGDFTFKNGANALRKLLSLPDAPTAIFCHSDTLAIGAVQEVKKLGLRVPEDISVVGFDDIEFSQYCDPPLTTISQPRHKIGQQAMSLMFELIRDNSTQVGSRLIEAELVIRRSVAPVYY